MLEPYVFNEELVPPWKSKSLVPFLLHSPRPREPVTELCDAKLEPTQALKSPKIMTMSLGGTEDGVCWSRL